MKFTKAKARRIEEFLALADARGCVPVTEWVSGSGRYTRKRALPPYVTRVSREEAMRRPRSGDAVPDRVRSGARSYFEAHPRREYVLVLDRIALFRLMAGGCEDAELPDTLPVD